MQKLYFAGSPPRLPLCVGLQVLECVQHHQQWCVVVSMRCIIITTVGRFLSLADLDGRL